MHRIPSTIAITIALLTTQTLAADIVFENACFRAVLSEDAVWQSLIDKASGKDLWPEDKAITFASVHVDKSHRNANRASLSGDRLTLAFAGCDTRLVYAVETSDDWIAFRLVKIEGSRPDRLTVVRIGVAITDRVGKCMNSAWNDQSAVCLMGINRQTEGRPSRRSGYTELVTSSQDAPGPELEGSGAALVVTPPQDLQDVLRRLAVAYDLPRNEQDGVASKYLPIARQSYWFLSFAEDEVDKVIECCRQTGFRQVMLSSNAWCTSPGHYTFSTTRYPDGIESLRRTVAKLHENDILVGMHCFASKISKRDAYVTPVPDRRFWVDMTATLAESVAADATSLRTSSDLSQWPGSPVSKKTVWEGHVSKHQEVIIDDEIVRYESIGPDGRWDTFEGCTRGSWKTQPAPHKSQTECRHYAVDGCINGYIVDQETGLFDEATSRMAEIFNTCDFDMVYFDGSEDVDRRRFNYYMSNFRAVCMSKFTKRPIIHMGGGYTHNLWHSYTRGATIDQYPGTYLAYINAGGKIQDWPTCKDHIDRTAKRVLDLHQDMTPGELGWFGIGPAKGNYDGLQFDEIEYLMCKSIALDAPISLQTGFSRMARHPLTPDILEIVRVYEQARLARVVPEITLTKLGEFGRDFVMLPRPLRTDSNKPEFVEVDEIPEVAGTHDLRSLVGSRGDDTVATLWHYLGKDGRLIVGTKSVTAYDVRGEPVELTAVNEPRVASHDPPDDPKFEKVNQGSVRSFDFRKSLAIPLGPGRVTLHFPGRGPDAVRKLLKSAELELRKPDVFWLRAQDYRDRVGEMLKGSEAGVEEPDALSDPILAAGPIDRSGKTPSYCEYRLRIPRKANWTLWARVRYPTGGDMSFGIVRPDEEVTLTGSQVLGNCGVNDKKWHWTGRGGGITTVPPGAPFVIPLEPGEFTFRVYPREGSGQPATNPRLDVICISEDPTYIPTDADAKAALKATAEKQTP